MQGGRWREREALGLEPRVMLTSVVGVIQYIRVLQWEVPLQNVGKSRLGLFGIQLATSSRARNNLHLWPEGSGRVKLTLTASCTCPTVISDDVGYVVRYSPPSITCLLIYFHW